MDDNTLKAVIRLCDLAENYNDSEDFNGRDKVLHTLDNLMQRVQLNPKPSEVNGGIV